MKKRPVELRPGMRVRIFHGRGTNTGRVELISKDGQVATLRLDGYKVYWHVTLKDDGTWGGSFGDGHLEIIDDHTLPWE